MMILPNAGSAPLSTNSNTPTGPKGPSTWKPRSGCLQQADPALSGRQFGFGPRQPMLDQLHLPLPRIHP
jgi:hypothetical protein